MKYVKPSRIVLRKHPQFGERWVQDRIAEDPAILGLGADLVLRDKERIQPSARRLDLLFQDMESDRRYEVEVQLGPTDESHIIRTIEYWDIERRRYPQYDHCAVIIAEDITSRFLNVIGLFNGFIPLIAIQMTALQFDDQIALMFTKVMDELPLGLEDEAEVAEVADRVYWEMKGTRATVALADELLTVLQSFDPALSLKYNKYYVGLARNNVPDNFAIFRPKKGSLRLEVRLKPPDELTGQLDQAGLDVMAYDSKSRRYRLRLTKRDIEKHKDLVTRLLKLAYEHSIRS